jgi:hypothetical protein
MSYYTLAHIDLKSAVEVGELARAIVGRVKLPGIQAPVPGTQVSTSAGQHFRKNQDLTNSVSGSTVLPLTTLS